MSAAAVIVLRRKKFVRRFRKHGATSPARAIPLADLEMRRSWVFDQMVSRGVFIAAGNDTYWMNEQVADAFLEAQRRRALVVGAILLVAFLIFIVVSTRW
jgi:hypothetical protein